MESKTALIIQFTGIFIITALSLFLRRSLKTTASTMWLLAWTSLSAALFCLSFGFLYPATKFLFGIYFFLEYSFGVLLIIGCRSLSADFSFGRRSYLLLLPFALLAAILAAGIGDFNFVFNVHALVLGSLFAGAFYALRTSPLKTFGWRVMRIALLLLALGFLHYAAVFTILLLMPGVLDDINYLSFGPVIDLVLESLLAFGMVIVLLEQVLNEVQKVNGQLRDAHERLRQIAHVDPLTTAFNRHAFYGFVQNEDSGSVSGCVGFFDIDDLKPINDRFGHAVGDMVIRAVVRSIRELVRAEDLIYRWGGDEFFVIMVSLSEDMARQRMVALEHKLTDIKIAGAERPLTIRVSHGFKDFNDLSELENAVRSADEEMYRRKQERKARRRIAPYPPTYVSNENIVFSGH